MGNIWRNLWKQQEVSVLFAGLDNAGKTTILYQLKLGEVITTIPTIGFNVESVLKNNKRFDLWDVGGNEKIRHLWLTHASNYNYIIWTVDSTDRERIELSCSELHRVLANSLMHKLALLVFANK